MGLGGRRMPIHTCGNVGLWEGVFFWINKDVFHHLLNLADPYYYLNRIRSLWNYSSQDLHRVRGH